MKHLFIINPEAGKGAAAVDELIREIRSFFFTYPQIEEYTIHVTRWKRDAMVYTRRYVSRTRELVRVYSMGGDGTFFEVVNGTAGLPNVQVAYYPLGTDNSFTYAFGDDTISNFRSLRNLVFSKISPIDIIRISGNYSAINCQMGGEAMGYAMGDNLARHLPLPKNLCYIGMGAWNILSDRAKLHYSIELDGRELDGEYISVMVTNASVYGTNMRPAVEALLNDSFLDLYLVRPIPKYRLMRVITDYENGLHFRWPQYLQHFKGKKVSIRCDEITTIVLDGEIFYDSGIECEVVPGALDFVCPEGISINYTPPGMKRENQT